MSGVYWRSFPARWIRGHSDEENNEDKEVDGEDDNADEEYLKPRKSNQLASKKGSIVQRIGPVGEHLVGCKQQ